MACGEVRARAAGSHIVLLPSCEEFDVMGMTAAPIDLTVCDREPIHVPGGIQPHGMMLIAEQDSFIVRHVAGAIEQRLDIADWEGQTLNALIGELAGKIPGPRHPLSS